MKGTNIFRAFVLSQWLGPVLSAFFGLLLILATTISEVDIIIPVFKMEEWRSRETNEFAQRHIAN